MASYTSLLSLFFLLPCCLCQSSLVENPSNLGREFILAFTDNILNYQRYTKELVLTTPSEIEATVHVRTPLLNINWEAVVKVKQGKLTSVLLPIQLRAKKNGLGNFGVHVYSDQDIVVVGTNMGSMTSEAYLGLPRYRMGFEYYVVTDKDFPAFTIVGTRNDTQVNIHLPSSVNPSMDKQGSEDITITLSKFETYLYMKSEGYDLSGVHITADKPVGVISGNKLGNTQRSLNIGKHLTEMMVPVESWGKQFITTDAKLAEKGTNYKFIASKDSTIIRLGDRESIYLEYAGNYTERMFTNKEFLAAQANNPIMIVAFSKAVPSNNVVATMATIIPIEQYLNKYTIISMEGFQNSLSVIIEGKNVLGLLLNGTQVSGIPTNIPNTNYVNLYLDVEYGGQSLLHTDPRVRFLALADGTILRSSYAYPAGMGLRRFVLDCVPTKPIAGDGIDNDCDGKIDEEQLNMKDDDRDGKIDEDLAFDVSLVQNPSNLGREFILAFTDDVYQPKEYKKELILTTPSEIPATVTITTPLLPINYKMVATVTKGNLTSVTLPRDLQANKTGKGIYGVRVISDQDIVVVGSNKNDTTSEAYLGLPLYRLGKEYYVMTDINYPAFVIVGTQNNTSILVHYPPSPNSGLGDEGGHNITITLNKYETYMDMKPVLLDDYTGVHIIANKPVGVISGNKLGRARANVRGKHLTEMMVPLEYLGKHFVTTAPQFASRGTIYKFLATKDFTVITLNNGDKIALRYAGNYEERPLPNNTYLTAKSNNPIMILALSNPTRESEGTMATLIPEEQYLNNYTIIAMEGFKNSISVVIESSQVDGLLLDGHKIKETPAKIPNTTLASLYLNVEYGGYSLVHTNRTVRFLALADGTSKLSSYAYPAGMGLRKLKRPCRATPSSPDDNIDNDCDGKIDEELPNLKDDDGDGKVDEDVRRLPPRLYSCQVIRDPHLRTFAGQHASLPIPCGYLLTKLSIRNNRPAIFDKIELFIKGGNGMYPINGRFYVTDVQVVIKLISRGLPIASGNFTIGNKIIEKIGNWTSSISGNLLDLVQLNYYQQDRLATLKILGASPVVYFRPAIRKQGNNQKKPPGLFVLVGTDLIEDELRRFPETLASTLDDTTSFKDIASQLQIDEKAIGIFGVLSALQENVTADNDQDPICQDVKNRFSQCSGKEGVHAFNTCMPILFKSRIINCLDSKVLTAVDECLIYMCSKRVIEKRQMCRRLQNHARKCPVIKHVLQLSECSL